ncbi:MAG: triose-phosphate isomerase [Ktedonobacterales bacterium]
MNSADTSAGTSRRLPIVAGNWKMNYGPKEARAFAESILDRLAALSRVECLLCPPFVSLPVVRDVIAGSPVKLGAQNMYFLDEGAYTGEISPTMLRELCQFVILGHSERRSFFGETDELVNKKVLAAFAHDLNPIVCVGEHLEERDANLTERVITTQVHGSLANLPAGRLSELVVAYEPVWAIGTGRAASAQDAKDAAAIIRALLGEMYGAAAATAVRIQYGGSVTPANVGEFAALPEIDGSLVGGASLKSDFIEIARVTSEVKDRQHDSGTLSTTRVTDTPE